MFDVDHVVPRRARIVNVKVKILIPQNLYLSTWIKNVLGV